MGFALPACVSQSEPFRTVVAACAALAVSAVSAAAQMPTVPIVQNGFGSTGMTLALNYGSATGSTAYALAVGWGPASARFQISGALGGIRPDTGSTWTGYGLRASIPLYASK